MSMIQSDTGPPTYPFVAPIEEEEFRLFPAEIENDAHIVYHGTTLSRLESILAHGFRRNAESGSASFAQKSFFALNYAASARTSASPEGVVLACRVQSLIETGVVSAGGIVHVYLDCLLPTVEAICMIPPMYVHR